MTASSSLLLRSSSSYRRVSSVRFLWSTASTRIHSKAANVALTAGRRPQRSATPNPLSHSSASAVSPQSTVATHLPARCWYSSYVYPFATEEPEVTVTTAKDHQVKFEGSSRARAKKAYSADDPFDDSGKLTPSLPTSIRRCSTRRRSSSPGSTTGSGSCRRKRTGR
jgi:hypothetical protein